MTRNELGVRVAARIGAMLLAMLGGVVRKADDVGRGVLRHADDFGRARFHQVVDFGRPGLHRVDDAGHNLFRSNEDAFRFADDAGHRWSAIDEADHFDRFNVEREFDEALGDSGLVVNRLEHHITRSALKQSIKWFEEIPDEKEQ